MQFSRDEEILMMLYSPGTRLGLISALREMSEKLDLSDTDEENWKPSVRKCRSWVSAAWEPIFGKWLWTATVFVLTLGI